MTLDDLDFMQFLPAWMRDDATACALAYAVENQLKRIFSQFDALKIYTSISTQTTAVLDKLAWQFNVPEYSSDLSLDVKRKIVQNAIITHKQRGTVAAVERVAADIFGDAWIEEWFDYDGDPYHFKVHTTNVSVGDEAAAAFEKIIEAAQNVRSYLEAVIIETVVQLQPAFAGVVHEAEQIYI